ncbi:vWA domain-containing protein [Flavimaricola marinus]
MLHTLSGKGALTVTTALVACGFLFLTPQGQDLLRPTGGLVGQAPVSELDPIPEPPVEQPQQAAQPASPEPSDTIAVEPAPMIVVEEAESFAAGAEMDDARVTNQLAADAPMAELAPLAAQPPAAANRSLSSPVVGGIVADADMVVMQETNTESFANAAENPLRIVTEEPVSTFSIDVDTASYSVIRQSLNAGQLPPPAAVRIEEMINYFPYDYAAPEAGEAPFRPTVTVMETPWNADTQLLHIGIQGTLPALDDRPPLNLVFLIDTSGSMADANKLPLLKQSFRLMLDELRPEDQVAIVEYAGSSGLVLPATAASERSTILNALQSLGAGGSTNGQGGLEQAYAVAATMAEEGEVSRILLATDGDFNVGLSGTQELTDFIAKKRDTGAYLSVLGFGRGNLDDATMQALAQNGNGIAAYIDTLNEAQKVLVDQLTGALFPIAGDVKVQVEFNPAEIAEYRLIGYETRALRREDFNNDAVDAGELGAGHSVTAIYEITPVGSPAQLTEPLRYGAPEATESSTEPGELAFLRLRWKAPGEDDSQLLETPVLQGQSAPGTEAQFAAAIAGFGQLLKGDSYLGDWDWDQAIALAAENRGADEFGYRNEAVQLMRLAQSLSAN